LFPSISHQNPFILIKFQKNSNQIPLVLYNNPSKSFCSHQVPRKFPSNSSCSLQWRRIGRWAQVITKVNGETSERLGQSAKRSATVRGRAGIGATWQADVCRVRQSKKSRFSACQVLWKICFSRAVCRAASFMCATHLWLVLEILQCMDQEELSHLSEHMHFRNTDGDRTCTRKEGDAEVRNGYTRYEGDEERKETHAEESKVIYFRLLWAYFLWP
jgi:hypothetical protein